MIPRFRQIVLLSLLVLHALSGAGAARAFVVCVCSGGGIVLEDHAGACACCAVDEPAEVEACCEPEAAPDAHEHEACSCTRFGVVCEVAASSKPAPSAQAALAAFAIAPSWSAANVAARSIGPGPLDLDPDPHDPLLALRTVVLLR